MQFQIREEGGVLRFAGALVMQAVASLHATLAENLKQRSQLSVDLSEVTECDAGGLQLLYAARKQAEREGKGFEITITSPCVDETSAALGLHLVELTTSSASV
jgi:anti-anti-sigma regulatory factor